MEIQEIKTEVKTFLIEARCPHCGIGTLKRCDGITLDSYPPQYPHECSECGRGTHIMGKQYPYTITEKI